MSSSHPSDRGSPTLSPPDEGSPTRSTLGRGSPTLSTPREGSPARSSGRDNPILSAPERRSPTPSALGRASPIPSAPDRENSNQSAPERTSPILSAPERRSPALSHERGISTLSALDRSPSHSVLGRASPTLSALDPDSPTNRAAEYPDLDAIYRDPNDSPDYRVELLGSPSILPLDSASESEAELPPFPRRLTGIRREYAETLAEYAEDPYQVAQPSYSGFDEQRAREARARLNLVVSNTFLRFRNIVHRPPPMQSEDSNSITISSASEESNQSLPERPESTPAPTEEKVKVKEEASEPPAKVRKISSPDRSDDLDGETCPICLDSWGNSGKHRLVALKCGHLFGAECVERWLKAQPSKDRSCPTCKTKASLKDLRFIYARKLIAADTTEITRLQNDLEKIQAAKNRTEIDLQAARMTQKVLSAQVQEFKKMLAKAPMNLVVDKKCWRFALEKNLEICKDGGCRVMTYNCRTYELYVSQKSVNYLFPGYGIRKVSCVDYTAGQFVHLHPKPIRDITYSQPTDLLLSVGLDSTARIVERGIPNVTVNAGFPLWSCTWDRHRTNEFYVGGVGGMIHHYDYRNLSTTLRTLSSTGDMSPVISVCSTDYGLMSCQLNSCWFWETYTGAWVPKAFPVTGAFMSMCYDSVTEKALISMRPKGAERSKLAVCSLLQGVRGGSSVDLELDYVINGSARTSVMSRSRFCRTSGAAWIAAHSESDATLYLHGVCGSRSMALPAAEPALDVCAVDVNGVSILAALSESRLRLYKSVVTNV